MSPTRNATTLAVSIARPPHVVYDFVRDAANLPRWAPAFCRAARREGEGWVVETPDGEEMPIRFAARNEHGVLDHVVSPAPGVEVLNPMRVVANGGGSEVTFTLFQAPDATDEAFARDAGMVERDLRTLKRVLEG